MELYLPLLAVLFCLCVQQRVRGTMFGRRDNTNCTPNDCSHCKFGWCRDKNLTEQEILQVFRGLFLNNHDVKDCDRKLYGRVLPTLEPGLVTKHRTRATYAGAGNPQIPRDAIPRQLLNRRFIHVPHNAQSVYTRALTQNPRWRLRTRFYVTSPRRSYFSARTLYGKKRRRRKRQNEADEYVDDRTRRDTHEEFSNSDHNLCCPSIAYHPSKSGFNKYLRLSNIETPLVEFSKEGRQYVVFRECAYTIDETCRDCKTLFGGTSVLVWCATCPEYVRFAQVNVPTGCVCRNMKPR